MTELTQLPTLGLDDITPETIVRELRGSVYLSQRDLRNAEEGGDPATIRRARKALADRYRYARGEKVRPYWKGNAAQYCGICNTPIEGDAQTCLACGVDFEREGFVPWECGSCGAITDAAVLHIGDLYHALDADCRAVRQAGPVVNGEVFAYGYSFEAAEYEQRTRR